jgi:hypothetical protein
MNQIYDLTFNDFMTCQSINFKIGNKVMEAKLAQYVSELCYFPFDIFNLQSALKQAIEAS